MLLNIIAFKLLYDIILLILYLLIENFKFVLDSNGLCKLLLDKYFLDNGSIKSNLIILKIIIKS